jgi:hypothetical protein
LSRSRSSWAGGDGSSVCTLARVSRGGGLKGATDSPVSRVLAKRPLRRFLRFTCGTGTQKLGLSLQCGAACARSVPPFHPSGYMDKAPVSPKSHGVVMLL